MFEGVRKERSKLGLGLIACLLVLALHSPAWAEDAEYTSVTILVKDAASGQLLANAHLTLRFREPMKRARDKGLSYSAKTNPQGRYKFVHIPKGTIHVIVTADRHQSFGQDFELEQDNQVIEVKLKKPQPLL